MMYDDENFIFVIHSRGSRFLDFWDFNFLQFANDWKNKTKVEKVFFFILMSSYTEMSFNKTLQ
jgi:hypothetical protein